MPCVFPWHPGTPSLYSVLRDSHPIVTTCPRASRVLPTPQLAAFRTSGSLKSRLCRAAFGRGTRRPKGCFPCALPACALHHHMLDGTSFTSSVTGRVHHLRAHFTCESRDVIYLITCQRCGAQGVGECDSASLRIPQYLSCIRRRSGHDGCAITRHFLEDDHTVEDFGFIIIDQIPHRAGIKPGVRDAMRVRFEMLWINRLRASLNIRRNWRISLSGGRAAR